MADSNWEFKPESGPISITPEHALVWHIYESVLVYGAGLRAGYLQVDRIVGPEAVGALQCDPGSDFLSFGQIFGNDKSCEQRFSPGSALHSSPRTPTVQDRSGRSRLRCPRSVQFIGTGWRTAWLWPPTKLRDRSNPSANVRGTRRRAT
jgi:hypothetical protein